MSQEHGSETVLTGRCGCGAVTYQAGRVLREAAVCHCQSCRKSSGAPLLVWFSVPVKEFQVRGALREHESSPGVVRSHCAQCGTPISYFNTQRPDEIDVVQATLDEPERVPPGYHIWISDKPDWVQIGDSLPQFDQWRYS